MYRRVRDFIVSDEFAFYIHLRVVLVAVIVRTVFLDPTGIGIFLPSLMRVLLEGLRQPTRFDLLILLALVALSGNLHQTGIHHRAASGLKATLGQESIKALE